jgi:hypothetical protein
MAHFAKVEEGWVTNVIVADEEFIASLPDANLWIQTSYNTRGGVHYNPETNLPSEDQSKALRKNYAGIGFKYDYEKDVFIPPRPFNSWILNEETYLWEPPSPEPAPTETSYYVWDEYTVMWREISATWSPVEQGQ